MLELIEIADDYSICVPRATHCRMCNGQSAKTKIKDGLINTFLRFAASFLDILLITPEDKYTQKRHGIAAARPPPPSAAPTRRPLIYGHATTT